VDGVMVVGEARAMDYATYANELRAIESKYAPADGNDDAAYKRQLEAWRKHEPDREEACHTQDATGAWIFVRLCARYGIRPYRRRRQKPTTITVKVPEGFMSKILWPQTQAMMLVFARANVQLANNILGAWLGKEEATKMLTVEELASAGE
jgi:hypothetical protein